MYRPNDPQPGDFILDRYLSEADEATREEAREDLRRYALHLIAIGDRILSRRMAVSDSTNPDRRPTISIFPDL